jgi:RNA polymerase sigma factor (sigma-70 family)
MTTHPQRLRLIDERPSGGERAGQGPHEPTQPDTDASRALENVVGRFDALIRRAARRHGLAGDEVDEAVQDLRLRIWKSLGTAELIRRANPSYVYRAAISAAIDIIRRRRARRFDAAAMGRDVTDDLPDPRQSTDGRLEASELSAAVHRAMALLAESRRAVVRMHLAGYDRDEIAELLGWSEAKTRNLLYRGLGDLRQILESWGIRPGGSR